MLFNGFKPLFTALTPADVNQFAFEVIKVLQGEGGTIETPAGPDGVADHARWPTPTR